MLEQSSFLQRVIVAANLMHLFVQSAIVCIIIAEFSLANIVTINKKKLYDSFIDNSMSAVLLDYRTSFFAIWNDLCDFYLQFYTKCEIFPKMFCIWLQTRVPNPRQNIFSVNNLMVTYHDFRKCKKISLEHVLAFFRYFAFRIACSKKMFYMSHRLDPKMYSINLRAYCEASFVKIDSC